MSQDLDTQYFGHPSESGVPGHQQWLRDEEARKKIRSEAASLHEEWERYRTMVRNAYTDLAEERAMVGEQRAYDALVDYVESNGLNWSEYDPRPDDEDES